MKSIAIAADHPSLPGHFPNNPIVPGVIILDKVTEAAKEHSGYEVAGIRKAKFVQPLRADENMNIIFGKINDDYLRFKCIKLADGSLLGEGNLILNKINTD